MMINDIINYGKEANDKYCIVITNEDSYSDRPEEGTLTGVEWFSFPSELVEIVTLHEGMFYQLFNNITDELISRGVVDYYLPEDLEDYDYNFKRCFV